MPRPGPRPTDRTRRRHRWTCLALPSDRGFPAADSLQVRAQADRAPLEPPFLPKAARGAVTPVGLDPQVPLAEGYGIRRMTTSIVIWSDLSTRKFEFFRRDEGILGWMTSSARALNAWIVH